MFENGKPFFDMKTEHHVAYFKTINCLIPGLKFANKSYISEHMLIKTQFMKNLLDRLESNTKLAGQTFWEKILMAIDSKNIVCTNKILVKPNILKLGIYTKYIVNKNKNYLFLEILFIRLQKNLLSIQKLKKD